MKCLSWYILRMAGWKVDPFTPKEKKYILIVAPHTSNWDFIVGRLAFWTKSLPAKFLIKKEFFRFPVAGLLRRLGGLPVNRGSAAGMVDEVVKMLDEHDRMALIITPEGTRSYNKKWKKGFYHIALKANVPLYAGYMDYKKKECRIVKSINLTGDWETDWAKIRSVYEGIQAKHPENFCLP